MTICIFAAGGSVANGTFKQVTTHLDVPANEYERFSTVVYDSVTGQTKVELLHNLIIMPYTKNDVCIAIGGNIATRVHTANFNQASKEGTGACNCL